MAITLFPSFKNKLHETEESFFQENLETGNHSPTLTGSARTRAGPLRVGCLHRGRAKRGAVQRRDGFGRYLFLFHRSQG